MILQTLRDGQLTQTEKPEGFAKQYDVIVVGGGSAGCIAAIQLVRSGRRVLVVERLTGLGGAFTAGVFGYYFGSPGGLYEQIDDKITQMTQANDWVPGGRAFNPIVRRHLVEQEILHNGGEIAFEAVLTGAYMHNGAVAGVQYLHNGELINAGCTIAIDSTAEAYLCQLAGAELTFGREGDESCQPYSNVYLVYNKQRNSIGVIPPDAGYIRQNDPEDYSRAPVRSAQDAAHLRERYSDDPLDLAMAPLLGVREGLLLQGEERVTLRDAMEGRETEKPLFYSYSNFDNHGKDIAFEEQPQVDWLVGMSLWGLNVSMGIPMGALIPRGIGGLIAAGRHISIDHCAASQMRMLRDCQKCGEAAGVIADMALSCGVAPAAVEYEWIRPLLMESGCLNEDNNVGYVDLPPPGEPQKLDMPRGEEQIRARLMSDRPGMGMLAAWQGGMTEALRKWVQSEHPHLRANSAITLALLDDPSGAPVLLELAKRRDEYLPKTGRKYNAHRGVSAVYALGRIGYAPAAGMLMELLENSEKLLEEKINFDEFVGSMDEYRFQYVSHGARALLGIARKNPALGPQIAQKLRAVVFAEDFRVFVTLKASNNTIFEMTRRLREYVSLQLEALGL